MSRHETGPLVVVFRGGELSEGIIPLMLHLHTNHTMIIEPFEANPSDLAILEGLRDRAQEQGRVPKEERRE